MLSMDHSLLPYNTFGIDVKADQLVKVITESQLVELILSADATKPKFILGGGSNLLLTRDIPFLVIKNEIGCRRFELMEDNRVLVTAGGGEHWHDFVVWCLKHDFGGLENLSLIPGTVGAAPIQNIGAYGVELKDVFHSLKAIDLSTGEKQIFMPEDCDFGYRDSIFKRSLKGKFCITEVSFLLTSANHVVNDGYGAIRSVLAEKGITQPGIRGYS